MLVFYQKLINNRAAICYLNNIPRFEHNTEGKLLSNAYGRLFTNMDYKGASPFDGGHLPMAGRGATPASFLKEGHNWVSGWEAKGLLNNLYLRALGGGG